MERILLTAHSALRSIVVVSVLKDCSYVKNSQVGLLPLVCVKNKRIKNLLTAYQLFLETHCTQTSQWHAKRIMSLLKGSRSLGFVQSLCAQSLASRVLMFLNHVIRY